MIGLFLLFAGDLRWVERSATELELTEGGKTVFVYTHGEGRNCCYLHPLVTPGGVTLTDDGPVDHPHHRGLFWAWPIVEVGGHRYDTWMRKGGVVHRPAGKAVWKKEGRTASLRAAHEWMAEGKTILRDSIAVTVHPASAGARTMDVVLTIEAPGEAVTLAGAPEQNKGYGGLSIRYAPREATAITSSDGAVPKDEDHGAHEWVEFQGMFAQGRAGVRITADRRNPGFPKPWCLRYYGFTGANFPGVERFTLEPGKPVVLRYQVRVFDRMSAGGDSHATP